MFLKFNKGSVRPHLEYANAIWHTMKMKDTISVENVLEMKKSTKVQAPILQYQRQLSGDMI